MNKLAKKKNNESATDSIEEIFAKHGIKVVRVHKTGCACMFSNRPIPKNKWKLKAIMKNKHENDPIKQAHERLFAKYGIKTVWVDKTGTKAIFSNRPIPKDK